jgi:hypothetical protein
MHGSYPLHLECWSQHRSSIIMKCIELFPKALDNRAIDLLMWNIKQHNLKQYADVLSIVFTIRPMSFYNSKSAIEHDIRKKPHCRRQVLNNVLPRHIFTRRHESDYRDLNWNPRAAMMMLMSQMNVQQLSRQ